MDDKKQGFICVEYPGIVKNIPKAIETMGGIESLAEVFCDPLRLLQVRFRPEDKLCKPVTANRKKSTSFLMKVRVKKKTQRVVSCNIVDFATEEFSFSSFCDFQFLAMEDGRNVYKEAFPTKLDPQWFFGEGPLILVPAWFSRSDSVLQYHFGKDREVKGDDQMQAVISTSRRKRFGLAKFLSFEDGDVPAEPLPRPMHLAVQEKAGDVEKLRKLFEERPIVSRCAIAAITGICEKMLKFEVPHVAYHFQNGPWRAMWVRFGYDPRKDSSSRIYQTLDFRINREETAVVTKRQTRVRKPHQLRQVTKSSQETKPTDTHIITPGKLPPSRQFFYQYCDVHLPEVQAMLKAIEPRLECHPTDGWFPEGTSFACRRVIKQYIFDTLKQRSEDFPVFSDYSDLSEDEISSEADN